MTELEGKCKWISKDGIALKDNGPLDLKTDLVGELGYPPILRESVTVNHSPFSEDVGPS